MTNRVFATYNGKKLFQYAVTFWYRTSLLEYDNVKWFSLRHAFLNQSFRL